MKQLLFCGLFLLMAGAVRGETNTITCEIKFLEAPRSEINRLLPSTGYELSAAVLQQLQKLVDDKKAFIRGQSRIATQPGIQSQVKSVREDIYPVDFTSYVDGAETNHFTSGPGGFRTREVGVIFNCTPEIVPEGHLIAVALTPEISKLGNPPVVKSEYKSPSGTVVTDNPDFYTWSLSTTAILKSGTTVLVGLHDAVTNQQMTGTTNVVLILLTASINPVE